MTYLLLQTFLLLLSSYFFGAFVACLVKRTLNATRAAVPAAVVAQPAPKAEPRPLPVSAPARVAAPAVLKPHTYEPIQPKIDILPRPEPRPAPVPLDTARFDRALAGAQLPDTTPRKMIVEIRPQCLKPVTQRGGPPDRSLDKPKPVPAVAKPVPAAPAAAQPAAPQPKVPAQSSTPIVTKPQQVVPPAAAAAAPASQPSPAAAGQASSTAAAAAAAAALAAGKAAASPQASQVATPPAPQPQKAPQAPPPPAAQPAAATKPLSAGADDFLRIRAIDDAVAGKLHGIGVKSFEDMARWTPADIARVSQMLSLAGRIEREQWVEQAQILAKGGETYYSRNRASMLQPPPASSPADAAKPSAPVVPAQATAAPAPVTKPAPPPAQAAPQPVSQATVTPAAPPKAAPSPSPAPPSAPSVPPQESAAPPAPAMAPGVASAAAAAAAAAAALSGRSSAAPAAPQPAPPKPVSPAVQPSPPVQTAAPAVAKPAAPAPAPVTPAAPPAATPAAANPTPAAAPQAPLSAAEALAQRTPAEMAAAAAAAFAAASASVTRGIRPIEPLSPLSKADPNVLHPARLVDAIKEKESKEQDGKEPRDVDGLRSVRSPGLLSSKAPEEFDDLKRIRGIGVLIEKRLNSLGVTSYEQIAKWTASDVDRVSEQLDFKGRIERENWIEQARILASGGHTEFSRRVDKGEVDSSKA